MEENLKLEDRKKIVTYLKGKEQVAVAELIEKSGAEPLRIYPLLFELAQNKEISVLKETGLGAPDVIALL